MEQEPQPDFSEESAELTKVEETAETKVSSGIEALPEQWGFIESEELRQLHPQVVEAFTANDEAKIEEVVSRYLNLAHDVIDQLPDEGRAAGQIALSVQMALMRRDGNRIADYLDDLRECTL